MKDNATTRKINEIMYNLMPKISSFSEGYSVISDSDQSPHTFVEIYVSQIGLAEYQSILEEFSKYFKDVVQNSFIIPDGTMVHQRMRMIFHLGSIRVVE